MSSIEWAALAGLSVGRSWALWLLLLPLLLWLLARRRPRPKLLFTGALGHWKGSRIEDALSQHPRRARVRPVIWLVMLALLLGVFGMLQGLRQEQPLAARWIVIVDMSPSMHLGRGDPGAAGRSRLERGVDAALAKLTQMGSKDDLVQWVASQRDTLLLPAGARPPATWLSCPRIPVPDPYFGHRDAEGSLWVTDRIPDQRPRKAGLIAVGGAAVPGTVSQSIAGLVIWDGEHMRQQSLNSATRGVRVEVRGSAVGESAYVENPLADLFRLWARERHLELSDGEDSDCALVLRFSKSDLNQLPSSLDLGRWSMQGEGRKLEAHVGDLSNWELWARGSLGQALGVPLVRYQPGCIELAWSGVDSPKGSQVAFALAWSELFDRCLQSAPEVVAFSERQAPGPAKYTDPRPVSLGADESRVSEPWSAWLAGMAASLALLALVWDQRAG